MKLEIYDALKPKAEKPVRLALVPSLTMGGSVCVAVVDESGETLTYLLRIQPDGRVHRCSSVSCGYGFDLDERGRVKLAD